MGEQETASLQAQGAATKYSDGEDKTTPAASRNNWKRLPPTARGALSVLFVLLALGGSILSVCTLGRASYRWHGFQVELRLLPASQGRTSLVLTPLGEVYAHTHAAPVALIASLEEIQVDEIKKLVASNPRRDELARDFERQGRQDLRNFVLRQFAACAFGACAAPLLFRAKRLRVYLAAALIGSLGLALVLGDTLHTFDNRAFRTPAYTGTLKQAPWVIQFGKDAFTKIEALSAKLQSVAKNLDTLYGRISAPLDSAPLGDGPDTFRVLHVSDIHNNAASIGFIRQVADQFKVKFIVDTGDLTDFGSPPEVYIVNELGKLPYPYVFVLGNHDSQTVANALAVQKNVTLLNGQVATIEGVTLLGLPNPASARAGVGSVDTTDKEITAGSETLLRAVNALSAPPDILAIHDPEESRSLWGRVPLVLCGHEHRYYVETHSLDGTAPPDAPTFKTVLCNAGTTGAAGGRYLDKDKGVALSCAVLTFHRVPASGLPSAPAVPAVPNLASAPNASAPPSAIAPALPAASTESSIAPAGAVPVAPTVTHPQLRSTDMIVLNGELNQYSITHYTFNAP